MIKLVNFQQVPDKPANLKYLESLNQPLLQTLSLPKFSFVDVENISEIDGNKYRKITDFSKKDWHDFEFIKSERTRRGPGENGEGIELINQEEIVDNQSLLKIEGLSVVISDKLSVNRSLPDTRPAK